MAELRTVTLAERNQDGHLVFDAAALDEWYQSQSIDRMLDDIEAAAAHVLREHDQPSTWRDLTAVEDTPTGGRRVVWSGITEPREAELAAHTMFRVNTTRQYLEANDARAACTNLAQLWWLVDQANLLALVPQIRAGKGYQSGLAEINNSRRAQARESAACAKALHAAGTPKSEIAASLDVSVRQVERYLRS